MRNLVGFRILPVTSGGAKMGYCTVYEVDLVLAQALTSSRPYSGTSRIELINIGNVRDPSTIPDELIEYFIELAGSEIDGALSQMYVTPLIRCINGQWYLQTDLDEYSQQVVMTDAVHIVPGEEIIIRDDDTDTEEPHIVQTVIDQYTIETMSAIINIFPADSTRVMRIMFPPPVNQIAARIAAANIYDRYFSAQASPNISDYGKEMRRMATAELNNILNGRIWLKRQTRIGDRFASPYLDSNYALRKPIEGWASSDRDRSTGGGG
jgi:hypothetical protein